MPIVEFPYTKEGKKNARAAARMHGGKYVADKNNKKVPYNMSVMIASGPVKDSKKKAPIKKIRTKKA